MDPFAPDALNSASPTKNDSANGNASLVAGRSGSVLDEFDPLLQKSDKNLLKIERGASFNQDKTSDKQSRDSSGTRSNPHTLERNHEPIRPRRPPPPPPTSSSNSVSINKRGSSENNLVDLDLKMVNLKLKTSPSRSFKQAGASSSFYVETPQEKIVSPSRSFKPPSSSSSSFYVESQTEKTISQPILRQPQPMNSGASSFYDMATNTSTGSAPEKIFGQREHVMQLFMAKRQDEYTVQKPFKIFVGTWNVNGQYPPNDVKDWLCCDQHQPDIYFIGFQELDLSKEAFLFSESYREDDWIKVVNFSLQNEMTKYTMLKRIRLVGMMLLVYVKEAHLDDISDVSASHVGTGILGRMGNKGGVGVRLDIHSSTICAVNSHLAAHMEQTQRRNEDFHEICTRLKFPVNGRDSPGIYHHDIVFWLGDLNYRIERVESEEVKQMCERQDFKLLRENDQLMIQKRSGNVFNGFSEGEINFRPTYKYDPGSDDWDSSDKCRTPAWCDRILYWESAMTLRSTSPAKYSDVDLIRYSSHMELTISDHKPVSALFDVKVKVIDEVRYKKVFEDENRKLDKLENEYLPTMTLSNQNLDFGEVKFQQTKLRTVKLLNDGMVPCYYEFICPPNKKVACKRWLTINKPKGFLLPGEEFTLEFEIYVNRGTAPMLNAGEEGLEDILIFHLDGGKDFFITVSGKYLPSCFGSSIETLCRLGKPIRSTDPEEIKRLSKIQANRAAELEESRASVNLVIPKELWALVDHLYRNAKMQEDLFQQPGLHSEIEEIRDHLDTAIDTTTDLSKLPGSNHSAAEALLVLLEAFPEPVIPFHLYEPCLEVCEIFLLCKQVLQGMTTNHRNVFSYIMSFLRELLKYSNDNRLDSQLLATIFSGLVLRPSPSRKKEGVHARVDRERSTKFIAHFLMNNYDV